MGRTEWFMDHRLWGMSTWMIQRTKSGRQYYFNNPSTISLTVYFDANDILGRLKVVHFSATNSKTAFFIRVFEPDQFIVHFSEQRKIFRFYSTKHVLTVHLKYQSVLLCRWRTTYST